MASSSNLGCDAIELHFERYGPGSHAEVDLVEGGTVGDSAVGGDAAGGDAAASSVPECPAFPAACAGTEPKCTLLFRSESKSYRSACLVLEGDALAGERCTRRRPGYDDCALGNFCSSVGLGLPNGERYACRSLCSSGSGCAASLRCLKLNGGDFGVCLERCEIFDDSCERGARCVAGRDVAGRYFGYCATFGVRLEGEACEDDVECGELLACEQGSKQCRALCDADHLCPDERRCVPLGLGDMQSPRLCVP